MMKKGYINANTKLSNGSYPIEFAIWIDDNENLENLAKDTNNDIIFNYVIFSLKYDNIIRSNKLLSYISSLSDMNIHKLYKSMNELFEG
jgi:hypothetical protein